MSYVKNIAIVGATGTVGKFIVAELLKTGKHEVTAITRADSQAVIPAGVKVSKVNYSDRSTLVAALRGQQVLIITMPPSAPKDTQFNLVDAAAEADVPYVIPNGWGTDPSHPSSDDVFFGPNMRAIQKRIEELGKSSWIEFVSGFWYEFSVGGSPDRCGFDFQKRSVIFFDDGTARIHMSTWDQTGRAVAKLLSLKEKPDNEHDDGVTLSGFKNKLLYFSSFYVSQKDVFESVLRVTGTKEEDWRISYENSAERYKSGLGLVKQGETKGFVKLLYSRMYYPEGEGKGSCTLPTTYNDVLGLPEDDLDERTKIAIEKSEELAKY